MTRPLAAGRYTRTSWTSSTSARFFPLVVGQERDGQVEPFRVGLNCLGQPAKVGGVVVDLLRDHSAHRSPRASDRYAVRETPGDVGCVGGGVILGHDAVEIIFAVHRGFGVGQVQFGDASRLRVGDRAGRASPASAGPPPAGCVQTARRCRIGHPATYHEAS